MITGNVRRYFKILIMCMLVFMSIFTLNGCGANGNSSDSKSLFKITGNSDDKMSSENASDDVNLDTNEGNSDSLVSKNKEGIKNASDDATKDSSDNNADGADNSNSEKDNSASGSENSNLGSENSNSKIDNSNLKDNSSSDKKALKNDKTDESASDNGSNKSASTNNKTYGNSADNKSGTTGESTTDSNRNSNSTTTEDTKQKITFKIEVSEILENKDKLTVSKVSLVPADGVIYSSDKVEYETGESAFDILKRICTDNNIQMEYTYSATFKTNYVEGIGGLYEFDCGNTSGWRYKVNGSYPSKGSDSYIVQDGDVIDWHYSVTY